MASEKENMLQRMRDIKKERQHLLSLQPAEALERLVADPRALEIVHSIPAEDLHLLIRDIGVQDALPILALAANRQWEYMLDTEIWRKDRLDPVASIKWLHMLLAADPQRLATWCANEKAAFTELFLFQNIEVRVREHDQNPSELGDDFVTFDDTIYFRILNPAGQPPTGADAGEQYAQDRKAFLLRLLQRLAETDYQRFRDILLESAAIIPAETEEEVYRLRNVRLAEKGFLPFDEAVGIYQPLSPAALTRRPKALAANPPETADLKPTPFFAPHSLPVDNAFSQALKSLNDNRVFMQLQSEFAGLCNQMLVADQATIAGRAGLQAAVRKAAGYLSIGLESIPGKHSRSLQHYRMSDIFRVGYGKALELKRRAENWHRESWCLAQGLPLSFWDEVGMGVVGGLLIKRPLFFDGSQSGSRYREFQKTEDIAATETILTHIMRLDRLLAELSLGVKPNPATGLLTYKNLLLTHWAGASMDPNRNKKSLAPLSSAEFRSFFKKLWRSESKPRHVRLTIKSDFLKWLADQSGLPAGDIAASSGRVLEDLFAEIEQELGDVSAKHIDTRLTHLFLITDELSGHGQNGK